MKTFKEKDEYFLGYNSVNEENKGRVNLDINQSARLFNIFRTKILIRFEKEILICLLCLRISRSSVIIGSSIVLVVFFSNHLSSSVFFC